MTGLQKWQLAVKYLAMNQDKDKFKYLTRHEKNSELDLNLKLTTQLEKALT